MRSADEVVVSLTQPGYAVRSTLANFGAHGFADVVYEDIGYTR